jgi:DNA-binding CsgD family transcriptional regulator/tetratricopeptide (TPR) repeat protein
MMAALQSAIEGDPAVVIVGGEAGVGKTRLVEEVAAGARRAGVEVLTGCCVALGGAGLALSPVVDALRPLIQAMAPDELEALLGPAREELARLLPELAWPGGPRAISISEEGNARLLELVFGVIQRLAMERPVMLVIDDLHWADRSTLDLVALLVRGLRGARVLLVVTFRSDDLNRRHPLRIAMIDWERVRSVRRLELERFSLRETAGQLEAILGKPPPRSMLESVYERSEGNAFLSEEILGALQAGASLDEVPRTVRDMLLVRAERLSAPTFGLLRVASVAGRSVPDRLLSMVSDLDDPGLDTALREAVEHHLLVVDSAGQGYRFRHTLTRDAMYQDVLPRERIRIHRAFAEALSADPTLATSEASRAAALALHWSAANDLPRALAASIDAGRLTGEQAPAEALAHFEHGLELWGRVADAPALCGIDLAEAFTLAGESARAAGRPERALEFYDEALAELDGSDDVERLAHLLGRKAGVLGDGGLEQSLELYERILSMLPAEPPSVTRAMALGQIAIVRWQLGGDMTSFGLAAEEALAAAVAAGAQEQEARARMWLGMCRAELGDEDAGIEELRLAVEIADGSGIPMRTLGAWVNLSDVLERAGRHREAADAARQGLELAARVGCTRHPTNFYLVANGAEALIRLGSWSEAAQLLSDAIEAGAPQPRILVNMLMWRALIGALTGSWERAADDLGTASAAGSCEDPEIAQGLELVRSLVALAGGEHERARALVRSALGAEPGGRYSWPLLWLGLRIEAEAQNARPRQVEWLRGLADELPVSTLPTRTYRTLVLAEGCRAAGDGAGDWGAAYDAARAEGDPYLQAYALLRGAEQAIAAGDRGSAAPMLQNSALLCEEFGAEPLLTEIRTVASATRMRLGDAQSPTPIDLGAIEPYGLTERELEVFRLVAVGRSNKQIALELVISPKTASVHVSNLIGKLNVSNRTEAAALAHRIGVSS